VPSDLAADRRFTITEPSAPAPPAPPKEARPGQFSDVSSAGPSRSPRGRVPSTRAGPAAAPADAPEQAGAGDRGRRPSGDGRDDVVLGGTPLDPAADPARRRRGAFFGGGVAPPPHPRQRRPRCSSSTPTATGVDDLLVTKGGSSLPAGSAEYQPRLFLNDGRGGFRPAPADALPPFPVSVGAVAAADFDRSGRLGLFIGGRVVPGQYPLAPRSALVGQPRRQVRGRDRLRSRPACARSGW
jgi:enediyne biosynthesis protein E4